MNVSSITSIFPPLVAIGGGTQVTIYGADFPANAVVTFGGVPATSVVVVSDTEITCVSPPVSAGPLDVAVYLPGAATYALGDVTAFSDPAAAEQGDVRNYELIGFDSEGVALYKSSLVSPEYATQLAHSAAHAHSADACPVSIPPVLSIDASTHAHVAGEANVVAPPELVVSQGVHVHAADSVTFPPQISPLIIEGDVLGHKSYPHRYVLDFAYRPSIPESGGTWHVAFSLDRPMPVGGIEFAEFGGLSVTNLSQGLALSGFDSADLRSYAKVGMGRFFFEFSFTRQSDGTPPLTLDFVEYDGTLLVPHVSTVAQTAENVVFLQETPLTAHHSAHSFGSTQVQVTSTSPLNTADAAHVQLSAQISIRHTIPLQSIHSSAMSAGDSFVAIINRSVLVPATPVHAHAADGGLFVRHTSPLVRLDASQRLADDFAGIRNWAPLFLADANHAHSAEYFAIRHVSPLALSPGWHYHRVQAAGFLPADWIFHAHIVVPPSPRSVEVGAQDRSATVPLEAREASVASQTRAAEVPPLVREASVAAQDRSAVVGG